MQVNIIKFITSWVMPVSGFFVLRNLLRRNDCKFFSIKTLFILLLLALLNFSLYDSEYQSLNIVLNFISLVVCYKIIFKIEFFTSFILSILLMFFVFIVDTITYLIMTPIFGMDSLRNVGFVMMGSNICVGVLTVLFSYIKYIKKIVNKLLMKLESKTKLQVFLISFLWIIVISCVGYFIVHHVGNKAEFYISVVVEVIFIIFLVNYFRDKDRYISLNTKFDELFDYIQTVEDIIDSEQLNIHEYKNQLSVIKGMSKNKKINDYIDSIVVNESYVLEGNADLKRLPKGGLKGLIYYKCIYAKKKNLNLLVSINKDSETLLKKLSVDDTKILSKLLGVYLDNAIEASEVSENKNLSIEIYNKSGNINIVISNSIGDNVDLSKIAKKGYSTKGQNRGKGLYLVNKTLKKNPKFEVSSNIVNNYYIQRIVIKK